MGTSAFFAGKKFSFYRSEKQTGEATVVKTASITSLSQLQQLKLANEASFQSEHIVGFRDVIDSSSDTTELKVELQYIDGITLLEAAKATVNQKELLDLCMKVTAHLVLLHEQQIVHLNLNPEHILIGSEKGDIYFISCGLALRVQSKTTVQNKQLYVLAEADYIAPEQTGRIRSDIGYSSDLYSLGIIFYKLFTGILPFESRDEAAKIHAHIALTPVAPDKLAELPSGISAVIMKLLEKDIERRYRSAEGVLHDLKLIREGMEGGNSDIAFIPGSNDASGVIRFTNQLFGREKQIEKMMSVFRKTLAGNNSFLLVYGHSGVGKSSLVDLLYKPVTDHGGVFISGKFDSLKTDIPYFAFSQAFAKLIEHIDTQEPERIALWTSSLNNRLHPIGRVLFDIVPGLEKYMPDEPPIPNLNGVESQLRFQYAINILLQIVSELYSPLVIFMDDLQWSDALSLGLIKNILCSAEMKNILVIGAYRDNEITSGHIFLQFKLDLQDAGVMPEEISLDNLVQNDIIKLLEYSTGDSEAPLSELANMVHVKSGGNAFFVNQFIRSVYNNEMLYFDRKKRKWNWNSEQILGFNMEGDIVNLLLETVNKLDSKTVSGLKLASCIGNKFHPDLLARITGTSSIALKRSLRPAMHIGLILESRDNYMYFVHDRVQQAFYSLTNENEKGKFHLHIGRLLLENTPENLLKDSIYDIVNQFNFAKDFIVDSKEASRISELNFIAGQRSQTATAYSTALQYYNNALALLPEDAWDNNYAFTCDLHLQAASAANQCNNQERFDELCAILEKKISQHIDKFRLADIRIQNAIAKSNHNRVIELGLEVIRNIDIKLLRKPSPLNVLFGFIRINLRLSRYKDSEILALPRLENEELIIAMAIMHRVSYAAYFIEPNLVPLIMFELIGLTLKHGLGPKSPVAFIIFGYINIAFMNMPKKGIQMGELGNKMSEILKNEDQISSIKQGYHTFISHWLMHLGKTIPDLEIGFKKGLETGDFEFTAINGHLIIYWNFYSGEPIDKVLKRGVLLNLQVAPLNQELTLARINLFRQSVQGLVDGVENFDTLNGSIFNEEAFDFKDEPAFNLYFHNLNMQKKFLALTFNQDETAWKYCVKEKHYLVPVKGTITEMLFYFYENMCITALYGTRNTEEKTALRKILKKNLKLFKHLVELSEINYKHRYELLLAEYSNVTGDTDQAVKYYSEAIKTARLNKFIHDEALAWERTGMYYRSLNQLEVAQFYLSNAYKTYAKWGADAKLGQMLTHYQGLISSEEINKGGSNLDLDTVLKTINLISGEMNLENLLTGLMNLVAENAGAERAFLLVHENRKLVLKASVEKSLNEVNVLQNLPFESLDSISHSVINYVIRGGETLVLDDATERQPFANDPYIINNEVKSIVCVPLRHGGESFAYLYLENKQINGAFTRERIEIIQVMAAQTTISLQNTMLFEQTKQLNTELTQEVEIRKTVEENLRINEKRLEEYNANLEHKVQERTFDLNTEKEKSEELLLNILPFDIAMELKENGKAEAKTYESVSVMFTDFKGFTGIAEKMSATELVAEIDFCFRAFDQIIQKYKIEKIKTIGDSYMAVAGLPVTNNTHAVDIVMAALEIKDFIEEHKANNSRLGKPVFEIRIGINTGSVVAGIVGSRKFAYDIWGDSVNMASRMESSCEAGKVNISASTYELIKDVFKCTYRGKIDAKHKGHLDMYFVDGIKSTAHAS